MRRSEKQMNEDYINPSQKELQEQLSEFDFYLIGKSFKEAKDTCAWHGWKCEEIPLKNFEELDEPLKERLKKSIERAKNEKPIWLGSFNRYLEDYKIKLRNYKDYPFVAVVDTKDGLVVNVKVGSK